MTQKIQTKFRCENKHITVMKYKHYLLNETPYNNPS